MAKLMYFDFRCLECANLFDDLIPSDQTSHVCPECNGPAKRLISAVRIDPALGCDPESFSTMGDKWAKVREQKARLDAKRKASHGED